MINKIIPFLLLGLIASCGVDYDGEKRLVFETQVTDKNNQPIAGKHVSIEVVDGQQEDIISDGFSDSSGNLRLVFPAPTGYAAIMNVHYDAGANVQEKHITFIAASDFKNYKLALSPIQLYRNDQITTLEILTISSGGNKNIAKLEIEGERPDEYFNYRTGVAEQEYPYFYNTRFVKNQDVVVKYTVIDYDATPATTTDYEEIVSIGNDPVTYTINY